MLELDKAIDEITEIAKGFGLDFYPMRYEICPADVIYTFGAYGMPTRFSHWSFGKQFHKMKLQYDLGLSKIYELVINSDPCYAFLLNTNSLVQNKMIVAHVLAHCDFFKNNVRFMNTRRDMVESMSSTADRVRHYEEEYGKDEVEKFIDAVLAIQEHVDPRLIRKERPKDEKKSKKRTPISQYEDMLSLDQEEKDDVDKEKLKKFPEHPQKDLLLFIQEHSKELDDWQRDIMTMLREEMLYFWPQLETKIMNEGWASYWHARIMRELDITSGEAIEFASLNANVVQPSKQRINPYYLGLKLFEDIEERYDHPTKEMKEMGVEEGSGRAKLFEVRELESDQSFIRNYLNKELVQREDLFLFEREENEYKITSKKWKDVRDQLVSTRVNGGFPYIVVEDGDYMKSGELYLAHRYEGIELDIKYLEKVLEYLHQLWGRTVHLETVVEDHAILFTNDGNRIHRKKIS
ncbi:stage V sporulation protein R [Scopulibacillus darangshiensis]|uniref:Stage V sporulation protein R n=2 Tax=Scopulibacillus darangshiensis TaxID=442528 RepID=A0A4R2P687_9BACL|nr:SpoVR family protein [Scopulibacillus darangshiensis]TCP29305.1 stage V sporulation protein R [Scopulibacillus darangshiensis]